MSKIKILKINFDFFKIMIIFYLLTVSYFLYFNPYPIFYKEVNYSQLYYLKDGQRIKICGQIEQTKELENYYLIKICQEQKCISAHLKSNNEFYKENKKNLIKNKFVCLYGELKKTYNNFYLNVHSIEQELK
ncbi:MAG: hypothetical protein N3D10_02680 [Candidatus Micrarchaeota archaeon]|nr:hypothetical protein [Candidatus Micrarchaeota archaeon]